MRKIALTFSALFLFWSLGGQIVDQEDAPGPFDEEPGEGWFIGGSFSLGASQVSLNNWMAGGESSIAGNAVMNFAAEYRIRNVIWTSTVDIGYGIQRRGAEDIRKTDDRVHILTKHGRRISENLYYSQLLDFRTQMTPGYDYPDDQTVISNFLSPGYLVGAIGLDYRPIPNLALFAGPATGKLTMVMDQQLANQGAFGVEPGENYRFEFGGYIRADYRINLREDILLQAKFDLFSNYLQDPLIPDVNFEGLLIMSITRFISASVGIHLIYDQDMIDVIQYKQLLTLGLSYNF